MNKATTTPPMNHQPSKPQQPDRPVVVHAPPSNLKEVLLPGTLQALGTIPRPAITVLPALLPYLAYMVLVAGVLAVLCWNLGNKIITPTNGVLFLDMVPLTAFAVEALAGTPIAAGQLLGAARTGAALVLNNLYQHRRDAATQHSLHGKNNIYKNKYTN